MTPARRKSFVHGSHFRSRCCARSRRTAYHDQIRFTCQLRMTAPYGDIFIGATCPWRACQTPKLTGRLRHVPASLPTLSSPRTPPRGLKRGFACPERRAGWIPVGIDALTGSSFGEAILPYGLERRVVWTPARTSQEVSPASALALVQPGRPLPVGRSARGRGPSPYPTGRKGCGLEPKGETPS